MNPFSTTITLTSLSRKDVNKQQKNARASARELWQRLPATYRQRATFYTDDWQAYKEVIPAYQHQVCAKGSGHTNGVERFNCSLRQRVSRLVREGLSFFKKLTNHIDVIKYFICYYNQEMQRKAAALLF